MPVSLRSTLRPGDIGAVIALHGEVYAREHGFDATFEAYVAGPLAEYVLAGSPRERLWIAEHEGGVVGCVAIVASTPDVAQLRWFLVAPAARGQGLGGRLAAEAVAFARQAGYRSIMLWTERSLTAASRLYLAAGFRLVEEKAGVRWGGPVVEERYEMSLFSP